MAASEKGFLGQKLFFKKSIYYRKSQ